MALPVLLSPRLATWIGPIIGLVAGALIGNVLFGTLGEGAHDVMVVPIDVGFGLVILALLILRRQLSARARVPSADRARAMVPEVAVTVEDEPGPASDFEDGLRDIRKTDPGFDPTRFAGYTGMIFRDVHSAWMTRDIASLRQRLTPDMYSALVAQCERLRDARRSNRVDAVDVRTEITEAWQETDRDFVTAYVVGSMIDYTVDDASDAPVEGSRAVPRDVNEFWTFTRPPGLNFWMLSAIQTA
jgi:predicted lipid-binding transport protein (Tim44 family)